jgi:hypothetical protein
MTFLVEVLPGRPQRHCGDCQLCCKLLPVRSLKKGANERCKYQRHGKGCAVYPVLESVSPECRMWNCRWLVNNDTADLRRPDRSHYVIDLTPDYITIRNNETGERQHIQVVQIWVDPKFPDAHRDPALRAYLERRGKENIVALVRWSNVKGMVLVPPELSADGKWHEERTGEIDPTPHTPEQLFAALTGPA